MTIHSVDVLTYRYVDNPYNYPEDYPAQVTENLQETVLQPNWIRFYTVEQYYEYVEQHKTAFEAVVSTNNKKRKQEIMWERIKAYRDQREESGVSVLINGQTYWFHSDVKSLIKYLFLLFLATVFSANFPSALKWKTMGGDEVQMSPMDVIAVFNRVLYVGNYVFELGRMHREQMLLAEDPESYDYTTGWPPIFGEV